MARVTFCHISHVGFFNFATLYVYVSGVGVNNDWMVIFQVAAKLLEEEALIQEQSDLQLALKISEEEKSRVEIYVLCAHKAIVMIPVLCQPDTFRVMTCSTHTCVCNCCICSSTR